MAEKSRRATQTPPFATGTTKHNQRLSSGLKPGSAACYVGLNPPLPKEKRRPQRLKPCSGSGTARLKPCPDEKRGDITWALQVALGMVVRDWAPGRDRVASQGGVGWDREDGGRIVRGRCGWCRGGFWWRRLGWI